MTLNKDQQKLLEAVESMLSGKAKLGLAYHDPQPEERANTFTYLHENIEQSFRLKVIDLEYHDGVASAFNRVHSYKYVDDPSFGLAFEKEMTAMAVPDEEREVAHKALSEIVEGLDGAEKDAGNNPDMDEIVDASQPAQYEA